MALIQSCSNNLSSEESRVIDGFRPRVEIVIATYEEGSQVISLEPYLLRSRRKFGFLADFRFHPTEEHRGTQRSQQLSLSLDRHGRSNPNYYADRYAHLADFVKKYHGRIFPLQLPGGDMITVGRKFTVLPEKQLGVKKYIVGSGKESPSQFMGVKQNGPLDPCLEDTHLYFLFQREDRPLAHDLYRALRGESFHTFSGMERMFGLPLSNSNVSGASLSNFSNREIDRIRGRVVRDAGNGNIIPIVLTPFSRHDDPEANAAYWYLKHSFLSEGLPIQVVTTKTVKDKNTLKWSAAGIGLQVFAKAGGKPWKVLPETKNCLIVGIGQAHRVVESCIGRYFAYSVLTDSSGVFKEIRVLGESQDEEHYIQNFSASLREIFADYSTQFSSFVVHATFSVRRRELESIARILSEQQEQADGGEFISLKFNDINRFFGFDVGHNSRIPYESTMISLSRNEFLVWFEGRQYGQSPVRGRIGRPLHVEFTHPTGGLTRNQQRAHLQDAINLSGANWRGFNTKSLPISVYYAQIVAKYLKEFERHQFPPVNVNILPPPGFYNGINYLQAR